MPRFCAWRFVQYTLTCCAFMCLRYTAPAQTSALGLGITYGYLQSPAWNAIFDDYARVNPGHPAPKQITHLPQAHLLYEQGFSDHLYAQAYLQYAQAKTSSHGPVKKLDIKMRFMDAGLSINWYPVKMMKPRKATVLSPLYLRLGAGVTYIDCAGTMVNDTLAADRGWTVYDNTSVNPFATGGLGYDLHFGKRFVFQPFIGLSWYPRLVLDDFNEFVNGFNTNRLENSSSAFLYKAGFTFIYLISGK